MRGPGIKEALYSSELEISTSKRDLGVDEIPLSWLPSSDFHPDCCPPDANKWDYDDSGISSV